MRSVRSHSSSGRETERNNDVRWEVSLGAIAGFIGELKVNIFITEDLLFLPFALVPVRSKKEKLNK